MVRPLDIFASGDKARLFGVPPGVDFAQALVDGLRGRMAGRRPEDMARITLLLNSGRMQRRVTEIFRDGPPGFMPRIRLITDCDAAFLPDPLPAPMSKLRQRLQLQQLVARLLELEGGALAPISAAPDLADSLARLFDEMAEERVGAAALAALDVTDQSGHWQKTLQFLNIASGFVDTDQPSGSARLRAVADALTAHWAGAPHPDPVILAGSTGSRGVTASIMQAVARLPQGAVVLPGLDQAMPDHVWRLLDDPAKGEDHPQFRLARVIADAGLQPGDVPTWHGALPPGQQARNRLVSLALRPAPVTDQWMDDAPALADTLAGALSGMSLVVAATPREEAQAIALVLRRAAHEGRRAALITPDMHLTRMVTALLERWKIVPDSSLGRPLDLTLPGRLMRQALTLMADRPGAADFVALMKNPLVASDGNRRRHLDAIRDLELWLRDKMVISIDAGRLRAWAESGHPGADSDWAEWVVALLGAVAAPGHGPLADHLDAHVALALNLCRGAGGGDAGGELWRAEPGEALLALVGQLRAEAPHAGRLAFADYSRLFEALLTETEARSPVLAHPGIMIWGTFEARVQTADLVVLGGLNDGTWPELPGADPWLNRALRKEAGLLLPERKIGLAAHDFQIAIAAPEVVLTRPRRDAEADTVPSRWLNRIENLLGGMGPAGQAGFKAMRARGDTILAQARALETPQPELVTPPAPRPAPVPPAAALPRSLPVTDIRRLVTDPYALYARKVLGLKYLNPLEPGPSFAQRGIAMHDLAEELAEKTRISDDFQTLMTEFTTSAETLFQAKIPWEEARLFWQSQIMRRAPDLIGDEITRREDVVRILSEQKGHYDLATPPLRLTCKADRVDLTGSGAARIYDYKSGTPPKAADIAAHDPQLPLEALIVARGEFADLPRISVEKVAHIALGSGEGVSLPVDAQVLDETAQGLQRLIAAYFVQGLGFMARRLSAGQDYPGDFNHLARFGEWSDADPAEREMVK